MQIHTHTVDRMHACTNTHRNGCAILTHKVSGGMPARIHGGLDVQLLTHKGVRDACARRRAEVQFHHKTTVHQSQTQRARKLVRGCLFAAKSKPSRDNLKLCTGCVRVCAPVHVHACMNACMHKCKRGPVGM